MSSLNSEVLELVIVLLCLQLVLGILLVFRVLWQIRLYITILLVGLCGILVSLVILQLPVYVSCFFVLVQGYMLFHHLRFARDSANRQLLLAKAAQTQIVLSAISALLLIMWSIDLDIGQILGWIIMAQLVAAIWILATTIRSHSKTKLFAAVHHKSDGELPTLTVAIPARNETAELNDTLQALLENDYQKLEILVLDDCSQDKTSDIIRSFAHRGVRFIKGLEVDDKWLAKNHAYDQLMDNASGHFILFCGVDVRFDKLSLRLLMSELQAEELDMMSILPLRPAELGRHYLLQPMRYWRELALPRVHKTTPPCLSTCWVADRKKLQKMGGFEGLRRTIRPERYIARSFGLRNKYRFVRSSPALGITSVKSLTAQWQTALRTRYPELKSRPENVMFSSIWQVVLLLGPFVGVVYGLLISDVLVFLVSLVSTVLLAAVHSLVFYMTTGRLRWGVAALLPLSIVMEVVVINYSMWAYEYSQVLWKGRNICLPVLKAHQRLPKLT